MKTRLFLVPIAMALFSIAPISSKWENPVTNPPLAIRLVTAAPVSDQINTTALDTRASQERSKEATCENPIIAVRKNLTIDERNQFLIKAMGQLPPTASPEEAGAFVRQVKDNAPVAKTSRIVYVDDPSLGEPPTAEDNPDGSGFQKWEQKVKDHGCGHGDKGVHLASLSTTYQSDSVGWKSCYKTDYFTNYLGSTLAKIRLTSSWFNNGYMIPQYPSGYASATAYLGWSKDGSLTTRFAQPYAWYSWGTVYQYQNEAWQDFVMQVNLGWTSLTLDDGSLYINHVYGPGGRCL